MKLTKAQKQLAAKLNAKQLMFANMHLQKDVHGLSDANIYVECGYEGKTKNAQTAGASEILSNPNVAAYVSSMREASIEEVGLNLVYLDKKLKRLIDDDAKVDNLTLGYKRLGAVSDKIEMSGPGGGPIETTKVMRVSSRKPE